MLNLFFLLSYGCRVEMLNLISLSIAGNNAKTCFHYAMAGTEC